MPAEGKPWRFKQLGGEQRELLLAGWAAPFGRPRDQAVVRPGIRVRAERVFYPGNQRPTRHIFGHRFHDWELRGRFRDRARPPMGGPGFARRKTEEVQRFVADKQPVRVSWGDIVAGEGFIVEFEAGIEAEREIEWVLRLEMDTDDALAVGLSAPRQAARAPQDYSAAIRAALADVKMPTDLFRAIDALIEEMEDSVGRLETELESAQTFREARFAQLNRIAAAIQDTGTRARRVRETIASTVLDALTGAEAADATIAFLDAQAATEAQVLAALGELADVDRAVALGRAGRVRTTHIARTGDTWESLSNQFFRAPDRAGDIRDLNQIAPGEGPAAGVEYLIPT